MKSSFNIHSKLSFCTLCLVVSALFLIQGCKPKSDYPGYSKTTTGIHYKLLKIGDENEKPLSGDYVTLDIAYMTLEDSVFFRGRRKFQIFESEFDGSIEECISMLSREDSVHFLVSAAHFFHRSIGAELPSFLTDSSKMIISLSLVNFQSAESYAKEREAFMSWIDDFKDYEKTLLKQFIQDQNITLNTLQSGIYSLITQEGNGVRVTVGDTVSVHYEGWFLNGVFFDSTRKRDQAFTFAYGTEWQVIPGIELAISKMTEGEKAVFILPSSMAFGPSGSSTGIIPPFTSVIFEIELVKVIKKTDLTSVSPA